ncbi:hypothetical protein [Nonomuraea rhodomycinica]|uniref:Uncharacterized protein n=1 Tax=Nonomuraea rhodomycinica TaxID=1712872 RepID=A0A7Y6MDT4_9ACTN|nr:hypothetical protein [Nonomuraea rhodomycinica]NUW43280.1 hypothetical protein [Nonomuraea rhodomycinica]
MSWASVVDYYAGIGEDVLLLDSFCYTLTLPVDGVLTVEEAVRRLGHDPAGLRIPPDPYLVDQEHDLALVQIGPGVATIDFGCLGIGTAISGRLAGPEMRHWFAAWDIDGNTFLASRQPDGGGYWSHPANHESGDYGVLTPYAGLLRPASDEDDDGVDGDLPPLVLAVVEQESGVRLTRDMLEGAHPILRIPDAWAE